MKPVIMGILNVTPDSFFDAGSNTDNLSVECRIERFIKEGASIIDIGGISTKPGSFIPDADEEWKRLLPALNIAKKYNQNIIFSIDTFRASIAERAVRDFGISMVNDISAGSFDDKMFETMALLKVPYVIMHIKGTPFTMQNNPVYDDIMKEIILFFSEKIAKLRLLGIKDIIVDPGFGFGKTLEHNYELLSKLNLFKIFDLPILIGISRKSMIYKVLNSNPNEALNGTTVLNTMALLKGANILRVHDVKEAKEAIDLFLKYS